MGIIYSFENIVHGIPNKKSSPTIKKINFVTKTGYRTALTLCFHMLKIIYYIYVITYVTNE